MKTKRRRASKSHQNKYPKMIEEEVDERSAKQAVKRKGLRKDTIPFIRELVPEGWTFDEAKANEDGWYVDAVIKKELTPEDAEEIFIHHNYQHNRDFKQRHAEDLADAIHVVLDISIAVGPDNFPVVVNGQHNLWAVRLRGRPIDACFRIIQCRDKAAMAQTFRVFDNNLTRSLAVNLRADEKAGLIHSDAPIGRMTKWAQAILVAQGDFRRVKNSRITNSRVEHLRSPEVQKFSAFMELFYKRHNNIPNKLVVQGPCAAMYAMWKSDPHQAAEFIERYLTGQDMGSGHAILRIRESMLNPPTGLHSPTMCRIHCECMYSAWRYFCMDKPMVRIQRTKNLPPYNEWRIFTTAPLKSAG